WQGCRACWSFILAALLHSLAAFAAASPHLPWPLAPLADRDRVGRRTEGVMMGTRSRRACRRGAKRASSHLSMKAPLPVLAVALFAGAASLTHCSGGDD